MADIKTLRQLLITELRSRVEHLHVFDDDNVFEFEGQKFKLDVIPVAPDLSEYDLVPGQNAQYREKERGHYRPATIIGMEVDGSILLRDTKKASSRCIMPEFVEVQRKGQRGGLVWKPVTAS